jgi:F0F1-type ATP synthase assembly protein I
MQQANGQKQNNDRIGYSRWMGLGIEFCGVIAIFCYMGYKLDESLDSSPWCLLTGFFVAFIGMLYLIVKEARNMLRK